MSNPCNARPVRRVPGQQPFGFVVQGGDRTFNNLTVVSDLTVGSQATIPLAYAEEVASLTNLSVTACQELRLESGNVVIVDAPSVVVSNLNLNLNEATPGQLVTRDSNTGRLVFSNVDDFPSNVDTSLTLALNPSSGNVVVRGPPAGVTYRAVSESLSAPLGQATLILYDFVSSTDSNVTYAGGVFTFANPGAYAVTVMTQTGDPGDTGFFNMRQGGADLSGNRVRQTGGYSMPQTSEMTYYWSTAVDGFTMVVDFENFGNATTIPAGLTNSVNILRLW